MFNGSIIEVTICVAQGAMKLVDDVEGGLCEVSQLEGCDSCLFKGVFIPEGQGAMAEGVIT